MRLHRCAAAALALAALGGCATTQRPDPLEKVNRVTYAFNDTVDIYALAPVARAYRDVLPSVVRQGVTNFFNHLRDAWSVPNQLLQGKPDLAVSDFMRFGVNTVFGLGVLDWATEMGLEAHHEDFGQTLGTWGIGPGAYLVLPLLGPSNLRDTAALPLDGQATTEVLIDNVATRNSATGLRIVNTRADLLKASGMLDDIAFDKYLFVRDAYLQRRRSLVHDGNPPQEPEEADDAAPAEAGKR
jgi:phospholipid-binding lipoprotein MlaA